MRGTPLLPLWGACRYAWHTTAALVGCMQVCVEYHGGSGQDDYFLFTYGFLPELSERYGLSAERRATGVPLMLYVGEGAMG